MPSVLLALGALGAVGFVVAFLLDGATRPGYAPRYHPVSALALGPRGWLQTANFVVAGALVAVGGIGAALSAAGDVGIVVLGIAVILLGLALVASGVYPMDPMRGYPPGTPDGDPQEFSQRHLRHDQAGAVLFAGLPLAAFLAAIVLDQTSWRITSAVVGVATAILSGTFAAAWERDDPRTGLVQRAFLVLALGWLAAVLLQLR